MKSAWLQLTVLRAASFLAPRDQRGEWLEGWRSELWYVPRRERARFCLGAFRDALWLRRNNPSPVKRDGTRLESPLGCVAFLAVLAAVSSLIAVCLPGRKWGPLHLGASDLLAGSFSMLMLSCVLLPATRLVMGRAAADPHPVPWAGRLRLGIFLALKIALVQPIMFCGFFVMILIGPVVPLAPQLGVFTIWTLTFRWLFADQQRRCPVCLRLLTNPVRIGTSSQTFLEWYGSESMCLRGHGVLHIAEIASSYSEQAHWLRLGDSWSSLFSQAVGARQP